MDNTICFQSFWSFLRIRILAPVLLAGIALTLATPAAAVIYMKVEGIDGEVTAEGHDKWIEVSSLQWSVGRGISSPTGGGTDRETSAPSFSEFVTTKIADKTTARLFAEAVVGEGKVVEIHFARTGSGAVEVYQKIKLHSVMISSFSQSSGGDRPSESLSLNYTKIEFEYIPNEPNADPVRFVYNLALGKVE